MVVLAHYAYCSQNVKSLRKYCTVIVSKTDEILVIK